MPRELVSIIEGCWHPTPSKRPTFAALKVTFDSEPATLRLALLRAAKLLCVCICLATVRCSTDALHLCGAPRHGGLRIRGGLCIRYALAMRGGWVGGEGGGGGAGNVQGAGQDGAAGPAQEPAIRLSPAAGRRCRAPAQPRAAPAGARGAWRRPDVRQISPALSPVSRARRRY